MPTTCDRLNRFVALAGAAGVTAIAGAEVSHHVANQHLDYWNWDADWSNWRINLVNGTIEHAGTSQYPDLDAASSIGIKQAELHGSFSQYDKISVWNGGGGPQVLGQWRVDNLASGQVVSGYAGFWNTGGDLLRRSGNQSISGEWSFSSGGEFNGTTGYMGFAFDAGEGLRYGWMSLTGINNNGYLRLTVNEWAYDTEGNGLAAGSLTPLPAPGGLAVLALGAVGLRQRRRRA